VTLASVQGAAASVAVEAEDVSLSYGERVALDSFSLRVPVGSVFGLLGPNGSGKSTFVTLIAAMERPPGGTLRVFGSEPATELRARMGVVFQENASDPLMTVAETLRLAGHLYGLSTQAIETRARELLVSFGLADRQDAAVATLSGGMRRRMEMARALLHDPDLLLLDEPTTGVDPSERRALWNALLGEPERRRTILLATNDLGEADAVCSDVAFIRGGRVIATGTPRELKANLRRDAVHITWPGVTRERVADLASWPGAGEPVLSGDEVMVPVDDAAVFVPGLFAFAPTEIRAVRIEASSLEEAYFQYVGRDAAVGRA